MAMEDGGTGGARAVWDGSVVIDATVAPLRTFTSLGIRCFVWAWGLAIRDLRAAGRSWKQATELRQTAEDGKGI